MGSCEYAHENVNRKCGTEKLIIIPECLGDSYLYYEETLENNGYFYNFTGSNIFFPGSNLILNMFSLLYCNYSLINLLKVINVTVSFKGPA